MKTIKSAKTGIAVLFIFLSCILVAAAYWKVKYPFGRHPAGISLPGVYLSLLTYAGDHYGWFPRSEKGPYDALQQLYYEYCPSGKEFAGVSGNIDVVVNALRRGQSLDKSLTSWVYVPGFRSDDPENIAILWESKSGLNCDGKRNNFGGRAVLLLNGTITNVPAAKWTNFLTLQEKICKSILAQRNSQTNVPPPEPRVKESDPDSPRSSR